MVNLNGNSVMADKERKDYYKKNVKLLDLSVDRIFLFVPTQKKTLFEQKFIWAKLWLKNIENKNIVSSGEAYSTFQLGFGFFFYCTLCE